jgi:hypothetical protein
MPELPNPLHPAIVHIPIALSALVPLLAILAILAIRQGYLPARAWIGVVVLQVLLAGSAWAALETGEDEEDTAKHVVAIRHIHEHEEAAERMLVLAGVNAALVAAGLLPSGVGSLFRSLGMLGALGVFVAGVQVGHLGGELVYKYGAGSAYATNPEGPDPAGAASDAHQHDD